MKIFFDLLPVAIFFGAYKLAGIFMATAVAIGTTALQIGWAWWKHRKVEAMQWIGLGVIVVFGGATLLLHDETYISGKQAVPYRTISRGRVFASTALGKTPCVRQWVPNWSCHCTFGGS